MLEQEQYRSGSRAGLRLLLVDDEPDLLCALGEILEDEGYAVVSTGEGEDAVDIASLYQPNVLITDFRLPGIDGVCTIHKIRECCPSLRSILVSGHISQETRNRAVREHVDRIFEKPISVADLLQAVEGRLS
jgi:CheY-like chemotaxis protein